MSDASGGPTRRAGRGRRLRGLRAAKGPARLFDDTDLGVLWLTRGPHEIAVSDGGLWVRRGRRQADLPWADVEQVQVVPGRRGDGTATVEVFAGRRAWRLGPYPQSAARRWLLACGQAASANDVHLAPLAGVEGFAII